MKRDPTIVEQLAWRRAYLDGEEVKAIAERTGYPFVIVHRKLMARGAYQLTRAIERR